MSQQNKRAEQIINEILRRHDHAQDAQPLDVKLLVGYVEQELAEAKIELLKSLEYTQLSGELYAMDVILRSMVENKILELEALRSQVKVDKENSNGKEN